jgi:hypothetical protein
MSFKMHIADLLQSQADFNEFARDMLRALEGSCNHPAFLDALAAIYDPPHQMPAIAERLAAAITENAKDTESSDPNRVVQTYSARTLSGYLLCALYTTQVLSNMGPEQEAAVGRLSDEFVRTLALRAATDALIHRTLIAQRISRMSTNGKVQWGSHGKN